MKKWISGVIAAALAVTGAAALVACGDNTTTAAKAEINGIYGSGTYTFMSAYPGYTFKQVTTSVQTLVTYDDNSYILTVTSKSLSGELAFDPENSGDRDTSGTNDRGQTVTNYYGTYTASEEEGLLTVVLAKPTAVTYLGSGNLTGGAGYYNTKAWTEDMAGEDNQSAADYLASKAFTETTVVIDTSTNGFTYLTLTVAA